MSLQRKLAEGDGLICAQAMGLLKPLRNAMNHELRSVGNAYRTNLSFRGKELLDRDEQPFARRGWFEVLRRGQSFRPRKEPVNDQGFALFRKAIPYAMK